MGPVESLAFFAKAHDVPLPRLLQEIDQAVHQSSATPPAAVGSELADTIYRPFFKAGIAVELRLGAVWGAYLLLRIGLAGLVRRGRPARSERPRPRPDLRLGRPVRHGLRLPGVPALQAHVAVLPSPGLCQLVAHDPRNRRPLDSRASGRFLGVVGWGRPSVPPLLEVVAIASLSGSSWRRCEAPERRWRCTTITSSVRSAGLLSRRSMRPSTWQRLWPQQDRRNSFRSWQPGRGAPGNADPRLRSADDPGCEPADFPPLLRLPCSPPAPQLGRSSLSWTRRFPARSSASC